VLKAREEEEEEGTKLDGAFKSMKFPTEYK